MVFNDWNINIFTDKRKVIMNDKITKAAHITIAVDFDGTIVEHDYPNIGAPVPKAIETLRKLVDAGHNIILYTMRHDRGLADAIDYMTMNNIPLYGVNKNPTQEMWTESPKVYAEIYIDDAALGCPLIYPVNNRPYVDWIEVEKILANRLSLL
jgi:hypothetical protein